MTDLAESSQIIRAHLNRLLNSRDHPKTICPSEVARALSTAELDLLGVSSWRETMPQIRCVVAQMRTQGEVEVLQKGQVLNGELGAGLDSVVGPIRLRIPLTDDGQQIEHARAELRKYR